MVKELKDPESVAPEPRVITSEWQKTRSVKDRELKFIARGAVYGHEPDVLKLAARLVTARLLRALSGKRAPVRPAPVLSTRPRRGSLYFKRR